MKAKQRKLEIEYLRGIKRGRSDFKVYDLLLCVDILHALEKASKIALKF